MKRKLAFLLLSYIMILGVSAQSNLNGIVIDEQSGKPVSDAFIRQNNQPGVISDSSGQFILEVQKYPTKLIVSHVSYGLSEIELNQEPEGIMVIRIQRMISSIDEVQISAERMRILTEKDDYSIQDFAIDSTHIWMLGYINNRPKYGRLWISSLYADTLRSIEVNKAEKLERDVFGNIHLFYKDSVCQLYGNADTILLYPAMSIGEYQRIIGPIKGYFTGKLIYQEYLPFQEGLHTYYYSVNDSIPKFLTCIRDTVIENIEEYEYVYGQAGSVIRSMSEVPFGELGKLSIWLAMVIRDQNKHLRINRKVLTPVIGTKDKLYIVNLYKDSLLVFNSKGVFVDSKSIEYHKEREIVKGVNYKDITYLYDKISDIVFLLEKREARWILSRLNTEKGKVDKEIPLPDFAGMKSITVCNNAVYFLYPEKKYPFYQRLYRYQL